ncbi:MAG: carboxylesterase/lipase family protein [Leifsonia flava]
MDRRLLDERLATVRVTGGSVRGVRVGRTRVWRGIPYAAPPLGHLRFRSPTPVRPWAGIRDASSYGQIAPQRVRTGLGRARATVTGGEDCLTVNVRSPILGAREKGPLPVTVFIHGGGYNSGSSRDFSGQGESFVDSRRVVYVSFNYRLGALGYLDFTRYSTPARRFDNNLGLRDQLALLRWVQANIAAFGGDPHNVTVFGESAGGNAVTTLMATPSAHGLFSKAIAQSPPPDAVYAAARTAQWAGEYVELLRVVMAERAAGVGTPELLVAAPVDDLIAAGVQLQIRTPDLYPGEFCLAPVIDAELVPESPMAAFGAGRALRIPLIIGTNDREGSIFRGRIDILPRSSARIAALLGQASPEVADALRRAYPGLPSRRPAADLGGDYGFWFPSTRVADLHSRHAPVFAYRFDFAPRLLRLVGLDATHGVEMFALFDRLDEPLARAMTSLGGNESYAAAGERMRRHWLAFAESGAPEPPWPGYEEGERRTLIISDLDRVEADPRRERREAWEGFGREHASAADESAPEREPPGPSR